MKFEGGKNVALVGLAILALGGSAGFMPLGETGAAYADTNQDAI